MLKFLGIGSVYDTVVCDGFAGQRVASFGAGG